MSDWWMNGSKILAKPSGLLRQKYACIRRYLTGSRQEPADHGFRLSNFSERIAAYIRMSARILEAENVPTRAIKERVSQTIRPDATSTFPCRTVSAGDGGPEKARGGDHALKVLRGEAKAIMQAIQNPKRHR
jgi:hypothetical protein